MNLIKGLTLIELLVTVALLALLIIIAVPSTQHLYYKNDTVKQVNRLVQAIHLARQTALSKHTTVTLCKSNNGHSCTGEWQNGLIIFTDKNSNKTIDENDELIYTLGSFPKGSTLSWKSFGGKKELQITPQGLTYYNNGTFTYCPNTKNPKYIRQIIVNRMGKIRIPKDQNGDGIIEDKQGNPMSC